MDHPFQRWVDSARPRTQLWRTALGAVIVVGIWMIWTVALGLFAVGSGLITRNALASVIAAKSPAAVALGKRAFYAQMEAGLDTGPVLLRQTTAIGAVDSARSTRPRARRKSTSRKPPGAPPTGAPARPRREARPARTPPTASGSGRRTASTPRRPC